MTRISITIRGQDDRERVAQLAKTLAIGVRVDIKQERRSSEQNSKFWAMLGEVSEQVVWHGIKLPAEDWKYLFLDAYKREVRIIPNIEGNGFVSIGRSSSDLSVSEMADVITLIEMFGANHAVKFNEPSSHSSDAQQAISDRTSAPAATGSQTAQAAGVPLIEASLLSQDWRHSYITTMSNATTRAQSILSRHTTALQMLGGEPNESELAWMRMVAKLVGRRDSNRLNQGEVFAEQIEQLLTAPLPDARAAA